MAVSPQNTAKRGMKGTPRAVRGNPCGMRWLFIVGALLLGAGSGRVLVEVAYRLPRRLPMSWRRTVCSACRKRLLQRVPLGSFVTSTDRDCVGSHRTRGRYPVLELTNACLWAIWAAVEGRFGPWRVVEGWMLLSFVLTAAWVDAEWQVVPNALTMIAAVVWLPFGVGLHQLGTGALGALIFGGPLALTAVCGGIGMGDVKLALVSGLYLGWHSAIAAFVLSSLGGGLLSAVLLMTGHKHRGEPFAFAPVLACGTVLAAFPPLAQSMGH